MSDVIQCPQCDKRYRLPENPPATFTCKQCGTLMDLSDFGGTPAPASAPEAPAGPARRRSAGGPPRSRRQRARGGGRGGAPAPSGRPPSRRALDGRRWRRGARHGEWDEEPHGGYAQRAQRKQGNGLLIGSLIGLAAAVILLVVMLNKGEDKPTRSEGDGGTTTASNGGGGAPDTAGGNSASVVKPPKDASGNELTADSTPTGGGEGEGDEGDGEAEPSRRPKPSSSRVRLSRIKLEKYPWPDEVDEATRTQVEEAIGKLYFGGRDGNEAEEFLVGQGRVIAGRLISEFAAIEESPGFHTRDGASRAGVIDTTLRKIDGVIERKFYEENTIRASSQPSFTLGIARRWVWWWTTEEWKKNPREPFDPFSETIEDLKNASEKPKKKDEGEGFGKRAGG